jgi:hypothetical protein
VASAGFVPGYSGGTAPVSHRLPYYALRGHPNYTNKNIEIPSLCQGKTPWGEDHPSAARENQPVPL